MARARRKPAKALAVFFVAAALSAGLLFGLRKNRIVRTPLPTAPRLSEAGDWTHKDHRSANLRKMVRTIRRGWPFKGAWFSTYPPQPDGYLGFNRNSPQTQFQADNQRIVLFYPYVSTGDPKWLDRYWPSVERLYRYQRADGAFRSSNPSRHRGIPGYEITFSHMQLCNGLLAVLEEHPDVRNSERVQRILPKMDRAFSFVLEGGSRVQRRFYQEESSNLGWLLDVNRIAPNRIASDAATFAFAGDLLDRSDGSLAAHTFLDQVFARQRPDGAFVEGEGGDISYQLVTIGYLSMLLAYEGIETGPYCERLERAVRWALDRIDPETGLVYTGDSSRTAGQEKLFDGSPKGPNYEEMGVYLYTWQALFDHGDVVPRGLPRKVFDLSRSTNDHAKGKFSLR